MFSLIEHITASPRIIVCGFPSSGKKTFVSQVLSKHVGEVVSDETTQRGYAKVNYKGIFSFYFRMEDNLDTVMSISAADTSENFRHTYFILFVNAAALNQDESLNASLRNWMQNIVLEDRKFMRMKEGKSNSLFVAVSNLDHQEAASIDDIDQTLKSVAFRKLLCNYGFPNYDKQVDTFIEEMGNGIGAKNTPWKDAWKNTEKFRNLVTESTLKTSSWISQQGSELASTLSEKLSLDESSLASIALIGNNANDRDSIFSMLTGIIEPSQQRDVTIQVVRNFAGYSFKLCNIAQDVTVSVQTRQLVDTSNGIIFVVSENIDLNEQKDYFYECLMAIGKTVPVLYVSVGFELDHDEWMKLSEGRFVCSAEYVQGVIPAFCSFITQKQQIKTSEFGGLSNILPQLEERFASSLDWTVQHQHKIADHLQGAYGKVSESLKDVTPHIQLAVENVSETVSERVKDVSNTVSSLWNSWWGGDE